ncbi:MAG: plasmid pRiA4b ORF-3 family protein [Bacteroidales bacterium]
MILFPDVTKNIVEKTFRPGGAVNLMRLTEEDYKKIPVLQQVICLCGFLRDEGPVKLTATGNLPLRIVSAMESLGVKDWYYERYPNKLRKETDSMSVRIARALTEFSGIARKRSNSLSLTKNGEKIIRDNHLMLMAIIEAYVYKLCIGSFDGYEDFRIGQYGIGLSLILVDRFGDEPRDSIFYADHYFDVFPYLCKGRSSANCYSVRSFERFMLYLGLVNVKENRGSLWSETTNTITRTDLFKKLISVKSDLFRMHYSLDAGVKVYQLKISLCNSEPLIWRRILVPSSVLLSDLHIVIQNCMGWQNYHLHQYIKDGNLYSENTGDDLWKEMNTTDYAGMKLSDLLHGESDSIIYEYDFGDGWKHNLVVERVLPLDEGVNYPVCTGGEMHCPPEDCGGIPGYYNMLEVLKNPHHEEYEGYIMWLNGPFDPAAFDIDRVNAVFSGDF